MATRSRWSELATYVATCVGIALACSAHAMLGDLRAIASPVVLLVAIGGAGLLCVVLSLSIAELASRFRSAPGVRTYLREAFGDRISLSFTFGLFGVIALFASVEIHACFRALAIALDGRPGFGWECGLILLIGAVNLAGLELPARFQLVSTTVLVVLLVAVSAIALGRADAAAAPVVVAAAAAPGGVAALAGAIGGAIFLYTGFEWVTPLGRRPASYEALIPRSMPIGIVILCGVFLLLTAAALAVPGNGFADNLPHIWVGRAAAGNTGVVIMLIVSLLSMITTFNAGLMGVSRLLYAVAREGRFFPIATRISVRTGAPVGAVIVMTALVLVVNAIVRGLRLEVAASFACAALYGVVYAAFMLAAVRLRRKPGVARASFANPIPAPVQISVALLFVLVAVAALASAGPHALSATAILATLALGGLALTGLNVRGPAPAGRPRGEVLAAPAQVSVRE